MIPASNFDLNLMSLFKEDELKNLKDCVKHCNFQLKNEQRSWTTMISDNKVTIIALVACSVIIRIGLNYILYSSTIVLPFTISPLLYSTVRFHSLKKEAAGTLKNTHEVFFNVLSKYASPSRLEGYLFEDKEQRKKARQKEDAVELFKKTFMESPGKLSSCQVAKQAAKAMTAIVTKHGDPKGLGSLLIVVFTQMVKDQRRLDKTSSYLSTCALGISPGLYAAQSIDELIGPYFFLASKSFNIAFITFTALLLGGCVVANYINHRKDQEIGKDVFNKHLSGLNYVLEIPQELHA